MADLDRYRPGRIVIWDDELLYLRVDGIFDTDAPDRALSAIVRIFNIQRMDIPPSLVVLRKA